MCEMVDSPDADLVSRTLEACLRAQWSEVEREGSTIVLRGLGPTHRVNRNDRAVFEVKPAEGGRTAIEAEVTYLASALVGDAAPQNELVQRKLDGVLELVRMDVDLARRRAAHEATKEQKPTLVHRSTAPAAVDAHEPAPARLEDPVPVDAEATGQTKTPATESVSPSAGTSDAASAATGSAKGNESTLSLAGGDPTSSIVPGTELRLVHRIEDTSSASQTDGRLSAVSEPDREKERSTGKIFAALLVIFVVAGAGQEGWLHRAQLQQKTADWRAEWSGNAPQVADAALVARQKPEPPAVPQTPAVDAKNAAEAADLAEPDPKKWLANWAASLGGQDAGAQAAFYADPVEKYFLRKNVSRADVLTARQADIAERNEPWAMELDDVIVAQQTDTTARVLMVKHIVTEGSHGKVDKRLPTQIRLKRIDGQWRIVSEQTLG